MDGKQPDDRDWRQLLGISLEGEIGYAQSLAKELELTRDSGLLTARSDGRYTGWVRELGGKLKNEQWPITSMKTWKTSRP